MPRNPSNDDPLCVQAGLSSSTLKPDEIGGLLDGFL